MEINVNEILGKYGIWGTALIIFLLIVLKYLKTIISVFKKEKPTSDFTKHRFFNQMEQFILYHIPSLTFNDSRREFIWRKFLIIKFTQAKKDIYAFVAKSNSINIDDLLDEMLNTLNIGVENVELELLKHSIPKVFIEKFNSIHRQRIIVLCETITSIKGTHSYSDYITIMELYLTGMLQLFYFTVIDAEITLTKLNGSLDRELDKLELKGKLEDRYGI